MKKSATKCKLNNGFITSSDRNYSWRVAPQHCPLPLHPVIKCKAISGLTKKCKFELGLLTKMCKLFSGRVTGKSKRQLRVYKNSEYGPDPTTFSIKLVVCYDTRAMQGRCKRKSRNNRSRWHRTLYVCLARDNTNNGNSRCVARKDLSSHSN